MFDRDTLIIAYDRERGEPRGARAAARRIRRLPASVIASTAAFACKVRPTGIDIRKGLQYECIGCAACADGCDQVMDKMGYARGLIRYASENALERHYGVREMWRRMLRPRTAIYSALLATIIVGTVVSLVTRNPLKVDVIRDRGALAREAAPGVVENVYRVQIMNTAEAGQSFTIGAEGLPDLRLAGVEQPIAVSARRSPACPDPPASRGRSRQAGIQSHRIRRALDRRAAARAPREIDVHAAAIRMTR